MKTLGRKSGIGRIQVGLVITLILIIVVSVFILTHAPKSTSSSTTTLSTTTALVVPTSFTVLTTSTPQYLDPDVSYYGYDYGIMQNVYETLIGFNMSNSSQTIPWLAESYSHSPGLRHWYFTLRQGIKFADGEVLNSTAVYFSLNRLLIIDGSTPTAHGIEAAWLLQQLLNTSLSTALSGKPQSYSEQWVNEVLAENFINITGPYTFTINVLHPTAALPYLLARQWAAIIAPNYVMQHDLSLWSQPNNGYTLPYPTLSGNLMQRIKEYFYDEAATCNSGVTPHGCATTYLDGSYNGSLAGTGPYEIQSVSPSGNIVLVANPNYWGGPFHIYPKIKTVDIEYTPEATTEILDLKNAAASGQAMAITLTSTQLYDVANRTLWLEDDELVSTIPGVAVLGPFSRFATLFDPFVTNVTNPLTGTYYKFQPFADRRFRLAFADSVNLTQINLDVNNRLGIVANSLITPGLPPPGSYNASIRPAYSYNPDEAAKLLLSAMMNPLTVFHFENGSLAPPGYFNNTFGCPQLGPGDKCVNPVKQTITLVYATGDSVDEAIDTQIANTINNISQTYNMGLTVEVVPMPSGQMITQALSGKLYFYSLGWGADYPWVLDYLGPMYAPGNTYPEPDGWNITIMGDLYNQAVMASEIGNLTGLVKVTNLMNQIANNMVMYLWTFYPLNFYVMTSNIHGFFYNPSSMPAGSFYFVYLY